MMAIADWVEIIDQHDAKYGEEPRAVLELQPSEIDRLRHDLMEAKRQIDALVALNYRYDNLMGRMAAMVARYKSEAENALDLARSIAALEQAPEEQFCPAPSQPVNVSWVYRAQ